MAESLARTRLSQTFVTSEGKHLSVEFRYDLVGVGWSECTLINGDNHVTVTASYLSDALRELVAAVCRVTSGMPEATASFDEEPGEYRWRLFRIDDETLRISILEFDELWSNKPDSYGKPVFDSQCRLRTFAGAVYDGCKRLLAKYGHDGYREKSHDHNFPETEVRELKRLLDHRKT